MLIVIHCVSEKKDPRYFLLELKQELSDFFIIFGTTINKRLGKQRIVYFPTSPK